MLPLNLAFLCSALFPAHLHQQRWGERVGEEPSVLFKMMQTGLERASPLLFWGQGWDAGASASPPASSWSCAPWRAREHT